MGRRSIVYGKGVHDLGKYKSRDGRGRHTKVYQTWIGMLERCYSERHRYHSRSYIDCSVCDEWLSFQNFASWFNENYIEGFALDKDILVPGNRVYSPSACGFVPIQINTMLSHNNRRKTAYPHLPVGVTFCTFTNRYMAFMCAEGKLKMLGRFNLPEEARARYLACKRIEVDRMANEWRSRIGERMYKAMRDYPLDLEKNKCY